MKIFILVWCKNPANAENSLLTFRTLRTGFPTAEVIVFDNCSIIGDAVRQQCRKVEAKYIRLDREIGHHDYLRSILLQESQAIFVDPDIIFWENVEHWDFSNFLMAGRLIPNFYDQYTRCHTASRLHTSLLWLPDLVKMREIFAKQAPRFFDPVTHQTALVGTEWVFWDTLAGLYHMFKDRTHGFDEQELNAYDHLFCGTHLDQVINAIGSDSIIAQGARLAKSDIQSLRGYWRQQDQYFAANPSQFLDQLFAD